MVPAFHVYGLAWTEKTITFFFDGEPYQQIDNDMWHQELFIKFDVETNYAWQGVLPDIATMGVPRFHVQWVRSYSIEPKPSKTSRFPSAARPGQDNVNRVSSMRSFSSLPPHKLLKNAHKAPSRPKLMKELSGKMKVMPLLKPCMNVPEQHEDPSGLQRAPYDGEQLLKPVCPPAGKI